MSQGKTAENPPEDDRDERSVFVKNVDFSATEQDLREHFKNVGEISTVHIRKNFQTG